MRISITPAAGIMPIQHPTRLPAYAAQMAHNCEFSSGVMTAVGGNTQVTTLAKPGTIKTLYRFGKDYAGEDNYWFHWTEEVDVAPGQVAANAAELTFFTGTDLPRYTDNTAALGAGGQYPTQSWRLGVPVPAAATLIGITGAQSGTAETASLVYRLVDDNGWYGPPSDPLEIVSVYQGQQVQVALPTGVVAGYRMSAAEAYHEVFLSDASGVFRYLGRTGSITAADFTFTHGPITSAELDSTGFDEPPADLKGLVALHNGIYAGFKGNDVYLSEPYKPWAFPTDYIIPCKYPVVGLSHFGQTLVVLTEGAPVLVPGTDPASMVPLPQDWFPQSCVSKRSIAQVGGGVAYASPDGLCFAGPAGLEVRTGAVFGQAQWRALQPETLHGYAHETRYVGVHAAGGFIFDPDRANQPFTTIDAVATAGFTDRRNGNLYLVEGSNVVRFGTGAALTATFRSKKFEALTPWRPLFAQVLADAYPVTLTVDTGLEQDTVSVPDDEPLRLAITDRSRFAEITAGGAGVRRVEVASSFDAMFSDEPMG